MHPVYRSTTFYRTLGLMALLTLMLPAMKTTAQGPPPTVYTIPGDTRAITQIATDPSPSIPNANQFFVTSSADGTAKVRSTGTENLFTNPLYTLSDLFSDVPIAGTAYLPPTLGGYQQNARAYTVSQNALTAWNPQGYITHTYSYTGTIYGTCLALGWETNNPNSNFTLAVGQNNGHVIFYDATTLVPLADVTLGTSTSNNAITTIAAPRLWPRVAEDVFAVGDAQGNSYYIVTNLSNQSHPATIINLPKPANNVQQIGQIDQILLSDDANMVFIATETSLIDTKTNTLYWPVFIHTLDSIHHTVKSTTIAPFSTVQAAITIDTVQPPSLLISGDYAGDVTVSVLPHRSSPLYQYPAQSLPTGITALATGNQLNDGLHTQGTVYIANDATGLVGPNIGLYNINQPGNGPTWTPLTLITQYNAFFVPISTLLGGPAPVSGSSEFAIGTSNEVVRSLQSNGAFIDAYTDQLGPLAYSPDGSLFAYGYNGTINIRSTSTSGLLNPVGTISAYAYCAGLTATRGSTSSGSLWAYDNFQDLPGYSLTTGQLLPNSNQTLDLSLQSALLAMTPDGAWIAGWSSTKSAVEVYNTGKNTRTKPKLVCSYVLSNGQQPIAIAISVTGTNIAVLTSSGIVVLHIVSGTPPPKVLNTFSAPPQVPYTGVMAFSPEGTVVAAYRSDAFLDVYRVSDGAYMPYYGQMGAPQGSWYTTTALAFSGDSQLFYIGRSDGTVLAATNPFPDGLGIKSFTITPNILLGGATAPYNRATATITLTAGPPIAETIRLSQTSSPSAYRLIFPSSVPVSPGQTVVTFPVAATTAPSSTASVTVKATFLGQTVPANVVTVEAPVVAPDVRQLTIDPASIVGGGTVIGEVLVANVAPSTGFYNVPLTCADPNVQLPPFVTIPPGRKTAAFPIGTQTVAATDTAVISAGGSSGKRATLSIQPAAVTAITFFPTPDVLGGFDALLVVSLNGPVTTASGVDVTLSIPSSSPTGIAWPDGFSSTSRTWTLNIPPGYWQVAFYIDTNTVNSLTSLPFAATLNGSHASATLDVMP